MPVYALGERVPEIHPDAYVHPDAVVIGSVVIGAESTVWPGATLRGDYGHIRVGERTSIQDGSIIHATAACLPCALSFGESLGIEGPTLLAAYAAGMETAIRVGAAVKGGFHHAGFHATGLVAHFSSAVVAARMLSLPAEGIVAAATEHGAAVVQRHGTVDAYVLPHRIDHEANLRPLIEQGVDRVLAIASVGSLRTDLPVGSVVCPG